MYATFFTVAEYAGLPLIPPFLQPGNPYYYDGVNFASAGAGALVETFQGEVRAFHYMIREKSMAFACSLIIIFFTTKLLFFYFFALMYLIQAVGRQPTFHCVFM